MGPSVRRDNGEFVEAACGITTRGGYGVPHARGRRGVCGMVRYPFSEAPDDGIHARTSRSQAAHSDRGKAMASSRLIAGVIAVIVLAGALAAFAIIWRPAIAAIDPPAPQSFDAALVKRGR